MVERAVRPFAYRVDTEWSVLAKAGLGIAEVGGSGSWLIDEDGKQFLDLFLGAGALGLGHSHPALVSALRDAAGRADIGNFLLRSPAKEQLARRLLELLPAGADCVFFVSSGSEAIDFAVKVAMGATGRQGVVALGGAYHGHTQATLRVSSRSYYREAYGLSSDARWIDPTDPEVAAIDDTTACVVLEGVQGEGGARVVDADVLHAIAARARDVGALVIGDEVQTGLGRTGTWWATEAVEPDAIALGKLLGGGLYPVAGVSFSHEMTQYLRGRPFSHFSTFGGSNLGCEVALATLDLLEGIGAPSRASEVGNAFRAVLEDAKSRHPALVEEIRGAGALLGLRFRKPIGPLVSAALADLGVFCLYSVNDPRTMRLHPNLLSEPAEVDVFARALQSALADIAARASAG